MLTEQEQKLLDEAIDNAHKKAWNTAYRKGLDAGRMAGQQSLADSIRLLVPIITAPYQGFYKSFDPDKHPRNDHGQFVSKEDIAEAAHNPAKAKELREKTTRPDERKKLDKAIKEEKSEDTEVAEKDPPKGSQRPKKGSVDHTHDTIKRLMGNKGKLGSGHAAKVAEMLAGHTHAELADLRKRLGVRASGKKADQALKIAQRLSTSDRSDSRKYAHEKLTPDQVSKMIEDYKAGGHETPGAAARLANALSRGLTAKELHAVKREHGLQASGIKSEAAYKIAKRLAPKAAEPDPALDFSMDAMEPTATGSASTRGTEPVDRHEKWRDSVLPESPKPSPRLARESSTDAGAKADLDHHDPANWDTLAADGQRTKLLKAAEKLGIKDDVKRLPAAKIAAAMKEHSAKPTQPEAKPETETPPTASSKKPQQDWVIWGDVGDGEGEQQLITSEGMAARGMGHYTAEQAHEVAKKRGAKNTRIMRIGGDAREVSDAFGGPLAKQSSDSAPKPAQNAAEMLPSPTSRDTLDQPSQETVDAATATATQNADTGTQRGVASDSSTAGEIQPQASRQAPNPQFQPRIVTTRGTITPSADLSHIPEELRRHLNEHQSHGAALGIAAMESHGGFLNYDGTGAGKTRQILTLAHASAQKGRKVLIVAPKGVLKSDFNKGTYSGSYKGDAAAMGVQARLNNGTEPLEAGKIHLTTYDALAKIKDKIGPDTDLIYDESHAMKNPDSKRAERGREMSQKARGVAYFTATPGDKAQHIEHLHRAGVFGTAGKTATFEKLGLELYDQHIGRGQFVKTWRVKPGLKSPDGKVTGGAEVQRRLDGLMSQLTKDGLAVRRELSLDGVNFNTDHVPLTPEQHAEMESVYNHALETTDGNKAVALMASRMHQEHMKIPHMVEQVKRDLAAGRQPVVFAARVNDTGDEDGDDLGNEAKAALASGGFKSPGTIPALKSALLAAGVPAEHIAELHGEAKEKPEKAMGRFQDGKAKIMLATIQSGGTGINLDDTKGDSPRSVHIMTPPFSANDMAQAIGRVHRLNTKSASNVHAVLSDSNIDAWNAAIMHAKMTTQGAIVGDETKKLAQKMGAYDSIPEETEPFEWGNSLRDTRIKTKTEYKHNDLMRQAGGTFHQGHTYFPDQASHDRFLASVKARESQRTPSGVATSGAASTGPAPKHHGGTHGWGRIDSTGDWGAWINTEDSHHGDTAVLQNAKGNKTTVRLGRVAYKGKGKTLHYIAEKDVEPNSPSERPASPPPPPRPIRLGTVTEDDLI
jgi:hypothetical protein